MIIGICGKSGSGKSTLARQIIKHNNNAIHLDIDKIGHQVLLIPEVKKELVKSFGDCIIQENNISRKKLGEIVFASRMEMKKLSDITCDYMQKEIDKFLIDNKDKIIVLDWLLLPLSKYFNMCNIKILLDVPYEIREQRAMKRDNISKEKFVSREKASINFNTKDFDYILDKNEEEFVKRLVKLL